MRINLDAYNTLAAKGAIQQGDWGDGRERADLLSALVTGAQSEDECTAQGWPLWLAEISAWFFDGYPKDSYVERGRVLATAIHAADARGVDWNAVFRRVRLDAILPIAMESLGDGDELWRRKCRAVVQHAVDVGGQPLTADETAESAESAESVEAAQTAWTAWMNGAREADRAAMAIWAVWATYAAGAPEAARAAGADEAAARDRIESALFSAMAEAET